jgi:glyoxylase-like metal-dependent hydrolase (beta-lactamase superfamily II)
VVRGFAIRHEGGVVLFDTGVGYGNANIDRWYEPQNVALAEALAGAGLTLVDVVAVVHSHLHFDHIGQDSALPDVPIYVQAAEIEAAKAKLYTISEWFDRPGARIVALDGEREVLPGIVVFPTPGHTPGHQSARVDTGGGLVVIAGQAIYSAEEHRHIARTGTLLEGDPPPDPGAYLASALAIVGMGAARVVFSHDEEEWRSPA